MGRKKKPGRAGGLVSFRAYITLRNGKRLYASDYGYKAWPVGGRSKKKR
ncbi:MAG TPA: hypothetical protein VF017_04300 [Thermoanaerobaculia bacterium]|nr:hypothetical protein [Thermoanaerobaculia bacterium]